VQAAFAASGRPAPQLLSDVLPFGGGHAVLMGWLDEGAIPDLRVEGVLEAMAAGLADFVAFASSPPPDSDLPAAEQPAPGEVWPKPHNALFDFEATADGAAWIDAAGRVALDVMSDARGPAIPGHLDWSAKNLRTRGGKIVAIYDWDAVFRWPETLIVGAATAHFPVQWDLPVPETPTPKQMALFVAAYVAARGSIFTEPELTEVAAAATYARAYKARCEHCGDAARKKWKDSSREALEAAGAYTPAMLRA
jgi:hypothetical protein